MSMCRCLHHLREGAEVSDAKTNLNEQSANSAALVLERARGLREALGGNFRDELVEALYRDAEEISALVVRQDGDGQTVNWDRRIDQLVTSRWLGLPLMLLLLALVFWMTIAGANVPSAMLATGLFWIEAKGSALFVAWGMPDLVTDFLWHGVYRGLAWVVAVMLPPMAIFFPVFTMLEDLGYLPRVAFNLDRLFNKAGAHGKQVLTMSMGFGCNAAGIIACRTIDSPRERLIAILTNNFVPCNGRWPTLIMVATVFIGYKFSNGLASVAVAGSIVMVVVLGVVFTLLVSAFLSRTFLKGEASAFTLELPPYRRPSIVQTLYTSLIDRTLIVLWRAIIVAAPAGAVVWVLANVTVGNGSTLAAEICAFLDPFGQLLGLDGVILLAYIIAIPANEVVVPTILMLYMGESMMTEELDGTAEWRALFVAKHDWTLLTAVNLMLFCLLHNPCATAIFTMYKETKSWKWTLLGSLIPLGIGIVVTFVVAQVWRMFV